MASQLTGSGLLPLWFKPYHIYHQMRIGLFLPPPGFIRGPLPLGPTSQRADQSALAVRGPVGRAALPQRDGGMGLAYMHINALDESTGSPADI